MTSGRALDAHVLEKVAKLPLSAHELKDARALLEQHKNNQPDLAAELQRARAKQETRRKNLTLDLADRKIDYAAYSAAVAHVDTALKAVDQEIASIAPMNNPTALLREAEEWLRAVSDWSTAFDAATLEERADMLAGFIQHVTYSKATGPVIAWQPWAAILLEQSTRLVVVA